MKAVRTRLKFNVNFKKVFHLHIFLLFTYDYIFSIENIKMNPNFFNVKNIYLYDQKCCSK